MGEDGPAAKSSLRTALLQRLTTQSPEERLRQSRIVTERVLQWPVFAQARVILGYSALPYEVDTAALLDAALAQGKRVALPRITAETRSLVAYAIRDRRQDLEPGPYGVLQPRETVGALVPLTMIELVLVPGVGFDAAGRRLGHGQGYYDRLLHALPPATPRLGLAFACQLVERIPVTVDDMPVQTVISA